jgi:hypothetical protein
MTKNEDIESIINHISSHTLEINDYLDISGDPSVPSIWSCTMVDKDLRNI